MKKLKVYIASPYSVGDRLANALVNMRAGDEVARQGFTPFIPLLTHFWDEVCPHAPDFWYSYDLEWMDCCDIMLRLPGVSVGAIVEESIFRMEGKPVVYSIEELILCFGEYNDSFR